MKLITVCAFYVGVVAFIAGMNLPFRETLEKVELQEQSLAFNNIPKAYVEKHFGPRNIPDETRNSTAQPYVLHVTRGWPRWFQNAYGYHYQLTDPKTGTTSVLRGFTDEQQLGRIDWLQLLANTVGLVACVAITHFSVHWGFSKAAKSGGNINRGQTYRSGMRDQRVFAMKALNR